MLLESLDRSESVDHEEGVAQIASQGSFCRVALETLEQMHLPEVRDQPHSPFEGCIAMAKKDAFKKPCKI